MVANDSTPFADAHSPATSSTDVLGWLALQSKAFLVIPWAVTMVFTTMSGTVLSCPIFLLSTLINIVHSVRDVPPPCTLGRRHTLISMLIIPVVGYISAVVLGIDSLLEYHSEHSTFSAGDTDIATGNSLQKMLICARPSTDVFGQIDSTLLRSSGPASYAPRHRLHMDIGKPGLAQSPIRCLRHRFAVVNLLSSV